MRSEPDEETLELARALSTRAGMLLEDATAQVVLVGDLDAEALCSAITEARRMLGQARQLLDSAAVLLGGD